MITLIRIELLKLRTAPAAWGALGLTVLLTVASVFSSVLLAGVQGSPALGTVADMSKVFATGVAGHRGRGVGSALCFSCELVESGRARRSWGRPAAVLLLMMSASEAMRTWTVPMVSGLASRTRSE